MEVTKIESALPIIPKRKRVAAYARVSKDSDELLRSLVAQVDYYRSLIQNNPMWEYAGVYVDEGITGTSTELRDEFKRLIADCDAGEIDLVLTKSISRFARNTVDLLNTVRHLKEIGVEVRFERENISTFSGEGELLLTILASFAQEESRSISENVRWAIIKGYENGKPHAPTRTYGYEWDGEKYIIVPEEAEVVRRIFKEYLSCKSPAQIAKLLNDEGRLGLTGRPFCRATIKDMLQNEIYIGNLLFQKTFSPDIRKRSYNHGERAMYRVEEAHEPIVSKELFETVQQERKRRSGEAPNKDAERVAFSGKVKCGKCGCSCSRRNIPHTKTTERDCAKRWICNQSETKGSCDVRPISEDELRKAAVEVLNTYPFNEDAFQSKIERIILYDDHVDFRLTNGSAKTWERAFSRKDSARTCFSGKLICGDCGAALIRVGIKKKNGVAREYDKKWVCRTRRKSMDLCGSEPLLEDELRKAAIQILGSKDNYEIRFYCEVDRAIVFLERVEFHMKDGRIEEWRREKA